MSWFARSLANTLMPDRRADEPDSTNSSSDHSHPATGSNAREEVPTRGVKEDLSELTQAFSRQFRGVASFLAPPPSSSISDAVPSPDNVPAAGSDSPSIAGLRSDLAEIGGRFRSGITKLSGSMAVSEISKIANTFLPFGPEEEEEEEAAVGEDKGLGTMYRTGAVGITEEVMAFVTNISMHPETWLDFPLLPDDEESDDFDMSDAQQEHALAVERLAPRLAALRIELCPSHMSEGCFWKIYFVLLHPRLDKHDAQLLSTPQIVEARALLLQKLQRRTKTETERHEVETIYKDIDVAAVPSNKKVIQQWDMKETTPSIIKEAVIPEPTTVVVTDKHLVDTTEVEIIDKSVIEEEPRQKTKDYNVQSDVSKAMERVIEDNKSVIQDELPRHTQKNQKNQSDISEVSIEKFSEDEDGDDWLKEETEEMGASGSGSAVPYADEDVSFSDLEDDDGAATKPSKK